MSAFLLSALFIPSRPCDSMGANLVPRTARRTNSFASLIRVLAADVHQRPDMHGHRFRQRIEIVAAFQHRDDAASAWVSAALAQLLGRPHEVGLDQPEATRGGRACGHRSRPRSRSGPGRSCAAGQGCAIVERLAERLAGVAFAQRRVPDVADAGLVERAGAGKQRHLVRRAVEQILVVPEDVLRAVAVVDVEVDDGDARRRAARA